MYAFKDQLTSELTEIKDAGLWKDERELTSPQSAHVTTPTMIGGGAISWMRCSDVVPLATHTRLPDRSLARRIVESLGARMR